MDLNNREASFITDKCIICNSNVIKPLYAGLLKCHNCNYVFANFKMTDKELFAFYDRNYFFGNEYKNYLADKKVIQKNFRSRLKIIQKFVNPTRHKYIFEIGCAYGFFLDVARDFFDIVKGMDITEDGVRFANEQLNIDVIKDDFLKYDFEEQNFDVVCMWDTIEHLPNPHLYLDKISKHMKQGALLALTTGDIESLNARIRKDKWRFLKPPEHLHYFSKRTITKILDNYGYDILYKRYCGNFISIDNVANKLFILNSKRGWFSSLVRKIDLTNLYLYIKFFDTMFIVARKR